MFLTGRWAIALAAPLIIPDIGEGQCVEQGPDGKPRPCAQTNRSPQQTRNTPVPAQPRARPKNSKVPVNVPCNQISWENNQKRQCAQRVQKNCKEKYREGTKEFQKCVYEGLTGGKAKEEKRENVQKPRTTWKPPTQPGKEKGKGTRSSLPSQPAVESSSSSVSPSIRSSEASSFSTSSSASSSSSAEQCIFPFYPDCRGECSGLPSYPTYEFEACLTRCDQNYQAAVEEYNRCLERRK